jgi:hypothetical protein
MGGSIQKIRRLRQLGHPPVRAYLLLMNGVEMMERVRALVEAHGAAVLATVDERGDPRMRWLTPALPRGARGVLYAVTARGFPKASHILGHARVEWMLQSPSLDEVITLRGAAGVVDNPSLRAEVLELLGPRLGAFWRIAPGARDLVVLETVLEEATRFLPREGRRETVRF